MPSNVRKWIATALVATGAGLCLWANVRVDSPQRAAEEGEGDGASRGRQRREERRGDRSAPKDLRDADEVAQRPARPRPTGEVIVRAAWGEAPGELGRRLPSEGAPEGPSSFAVDAAGRVHVLDQVNGRVQVMSPDQPPRVVTLPADTFQDLDLDARGNAVVMDRLATGTIAFLDDGGRVDHTVPLLGAGVVEGGAVTGMFAREDGVWVEVEHASLVRVADARGEPDPDRPAVAGRFSSDGAALLRASLDGPRSATVVQSPAPGAAASAPSGSVQVDFPMQVLGLHALDSDAEGRVYLAANLIREQDGPPFAVLDEREVVVVLARDGRELARVDIAPPQSPAEQLRSIRVGKDGAIYQLVCSDAGVTVERFFAPAVGG